MNGKPESSESFSKVKIFKPKPVRLCPPRRKKINQTIKRTKTGTINYPISKKQFVNLDDISIEEIDKDFKVYKENKEEEFTVGVREEKLKYGWDRMTAAVLKAYSRMSE